MTIGPGWAEIDELGGLITDAEAPDVRERFGVRLMREGWERRRADLVEEAMAHGIDVPEHLDILFAGGHATTGADLGFVARFLSEVQESISAIAQALTRGATRRGMIPVEIQELVRLRLAAGLPGSLALRLVPSIPGVAEQQLELRGEDEHLDDGEPLSLLDLAASRLIATIDAAGEAADTLLTDIAELGPRASVHLREMTRLVADSGPDVAFSWRSERLGSAASLSRDVAVRFHTFLEAMEENVSEVTVTGRLVGGSLVRRRFEVELLDESVLSGAAGEDVLPALERYFGQPCVARLQVRQTSVRGGETREAYTLLELTVASELRV